MGPRVRIVNNSISSEQFTRRGEQGLQEWKTIRKRLHSSLRANILYQPLIMLASIAGSVVVARVLGPELLAVIATISAFAATITTFFDFGLTRSLPKIMPDISVYYGQQAALRAQRQLTFARVMLVTIGFLGLLLLYTSGIWQSPEGLVLTVWFFPLITAKVLIGSVGSVYQSVATAAFHIRFLTRLTLAFAIINPLLSIAVALLSRDPYLIVTVGLVSSLTYVLLLRKFTHYDLDKSTHSGERVEWRELFRKYRQYTGVTYLVFLFNRFVYGLPLTIWVLTWLGAGAGTIGNAAIAISVIQRGWDVANIPLKSLRAPLLARLHAQQDQGRFRQVQRLMVAGIILMSGIMAVAVWTLGPFVLGLLYGPEYESGVSWGVIAGVIALLANFFSLGHLTLRQMDRFAPILVGLAGTALFIAVNDIYSWRFFPDDHWPLAILLGYVLGRALYWIITDLWTDARIFHWEGTSIKLRGLLAVGLALLTTAIPLDTLNPVIAAILGMVVFLGLFRLLGGVGKATRGNFARLLGPRFRWAAALV